MKDLAAELPGIAWPDRGMRLAMKLLYDAWQYAGLKGEPLQDRPGKYGMIRWCAPDGVRCAQYDDETDDLRLSTELVRGRYDDELIKSIGHEVEHARQLRCGHEFNEIAAEAAGERFLDFVYARQEERELNELKALKAAAALQARAFQRYFVGSSLEQPYNPRALYDLPRSPAPRARFSWEIRREET